jgi:hypothetical protein
MPAWWSQPLPPEPEEPEVPEVGTDDIYLSKEEQLKAWRLLELMRALLAYRPTEPISLDEIDSLAVVAAGTADLHAACSALERGCGCQHLVAIFT